MGVRNSHVIAPHAVRYLVGLVVLSRDLLPRRSGIELVYGVPVMELRVAGDVVMPRVILPGVLYRQNVQISTAVVLGVPGRSVRLRRRGSGLVETVCLFHLFRRLQYSVYPVGALVVHATAAHGFRKFGDHRPGHPGQIAQVALRSLSHHYVARLLRPRVIRRVVAVVTVTAAVVVVVVTTYQRITHIHFSFHVYYPVFLVFSLRTPFTHC